MNNICVYYKGFEIRKDQKNSNFNIYNHFGLKVVTYKKLKDCLWFIKYTDIFDRIGRRLEELDNERK